MIRKSIGLVLLAAAVVVTACSGSDDERTVPNLSAQVEKLDAEPPVAPAADDSYRDRDPQAVTAALWRLDPCRLIAPPPGTRGGGSPEGYSPHSCTLTLDSADIRIEIGQRLGSEERRQLGATNVAGAKAYVLPGGRRLGGCTAWLPVSFDQTIRLEDEFAECRRVRPILKRVVDRIDNKTSRQVVPGLRHIDTCALLERGLGSTLMRGRKVAFGDNGLVEEGLDECTAVAEDTPPETIRSDSGYATLELETYADQTLTFEEGISDTPTPADYASSGWSADFGTIRGRAVFGSRKSYRGCTMRWAESTTILMLNAKTCEKGRQIAGRVMKVLDGPPGERVAPQQPVLYGAEEPDRAGRGVCADYLPLGFGREYEPYTDLLPGPACHQYVEPDLPDDGAETVVAAEADPNVTCALSADAVHEEFTQRLQPATLDADLLEVWRAASHSGVMVPPFRVRPCVFVDPRRQIQVQVFVSSDPMPLVPDLANQLEKNDSGMRTQVGSSIYGTGIGYIIGLGKHPDDPGYVAVFVGGRLERSSGIGEFKPMQGSLDDVARIADTIVDERLAG